MVNSQRDIREALGSISPSMLKKNWEKNREDILRHLKWRGIFITREGLIPKAQLKKCIQLLSEHTRYQMMDLSDFSDLIE